MRIAMLVYAFPELSETFIVNQITGLVDAGHEVEIHVSGAHPAMLHHVDEDISRYRLLGRTYYLDMPSGYTRRAVNAFARIARIYSRRPDVLRAALNVLAHGRHAASLSLLYRSVAFVERGPYDIIHCQFGTLAPTALMLRSIGATDGKIVVSFRGSDMPGNRRTVDYRGVFDKGDLFLPVCRRFRDRLIDFGCDPGKTRVHHSGIRVPRFPYSERWKRENDPVRILTVARLVEKKGIAYALQAVARTKASGRRVQYVVAGDGPLRADLERLVAELGLQAEVSLLGAKDHADVIELLREAHLFVAPSVTAATGDHEGIPNVLKEAMATGLPVVATRHSGIPELVEDDVSGFLVQERDPDALAERLAYLIDHPARWGVMGRAGRKRIEAHFDSDEVNRQLVGLYQDLLATRRGLDS